MNQAKREFLRNTYYQILVILLTVDLATSHVRLTFPPARQYALDFLDNVRSPTPCGMPIGRIIERFQDFID